MYFKGHQSSAQMLTILDYLNPVAIIQLKKTLHHMLVSGFLTSDRMHKLALQVLIRTFQFDPKCLPQEILISRAADAVSKLRCKCARVIYRSPRFNFKPIMVLQPRLILRQDNLVVNCPVGTSSEPHSMEMIKQSMV